jgi:hypothetical protein
MAPSIPVAAAPRRPMALWLGLGFVALALAAGGTYWMAFLREASRSPAAVAASLRQASADPEAQKKAADEDTRRQAVEVGKAKAEAATKALDDLRRAAERDETGLRLGDKDRQKIQVALTSLGFTTGGFDGSLGPRSRQMIAAWQQKSGARDRFHFSSATRRFVRQHRTGDCAVGRRAEETRRRKEEGRRGQGRRCRAHASGR